MNITSFRFISYNLLPKLGDYTALQYNFFIESDGVKYQNRNFPSNYLIIKISDKLNMRWELDYAEYKLSDVIFEYAKEYITYRIRKNKLQKKETIEINEFHMNILINYAKENINGFSIQPVLV